MLIAISQRHDSAHGGCDALESSYNSYFAKRGATLIPMPNDRSVVGRYFDSLNIEGIILSGGGDISPTLYGAKPSPAGDYEIERDETERTIIDIGLARGLPILGICRGMEAINVYYGGKIRNVLTEELHHDEVRHAVTISDASIRALFGNSSSNVNSYHRMVVTADQLAPGLVAFATSPDKTIEGFYHPNHALAAMIWHPERETISHPLNEILIDAFLTRKLFWHRRQPVHL